MIYSVENLNFSDMDSSNVDYFLGTSKNPKAALSSHNEGHC